MSRKLDTLEDLARAILKQAKRDQLVTLINPGPRFFMSGELTGITGILRKFLLDDRKEQRKKE